MNNFFLSNIGCVFLRQNNKSIFHLFVTSKTVNYLQNPFSTLYLSENSVTQLDTCRSICGLVSHCARRGLTRLLFATLSASSLSFHTQGCYSKRHLSVCIAQCVTINTLVCIMKAVCGWWGGGGMARYMVFEIFRRLSIYPSIRPQCSLSWSCHAHNYTRPTVLV